MKTTTKPSKLYFKMSNSAVAELTDAQFRLYSYYTMRLGINTYCFPMNKTTAKDLSWSVAKVNRIRKELKTLDYITSVDQIYNGAKIYPITTVWFEDNDYIPTSNPVIVPNSSQLSDTHVTSPVIVPTLTSERYNKTQYNKEQLTNGTNEQISDLPVSASTIDPDITEIHKHIIESNTEVLEYEGAKYWKLQDLDIQLIKEDLIGYDKEQIITAMDKYFKSHKSNMIKGTAARVNVPYQIFHNNIDSKM